MGVKVNRTKAAETIIAIFFMFLSVDVLVWFASQPDVQLAACRQDGMRHGTGIVRLAVQFHALYVAIIPAVAMGNDAKHLAFVIIRVEMNGHTIEQRAGYIKHGVPR